MPDEHWPHLLRGTAARTQLLSPLGLSIKHHRDCRVTSAAYGLVCTIQILAGLAKSYIKSGPLKVFLKDSPPSTESREGRATSTANQTFILSMDPKDWFPQPIDGADKCCQTA